MEEHPIPQDVTGFKFRIIGSVTVKQFMYLLFSGVAVALLIFFVPMSLLGKIPLIVIFGAVGPFFAFVPIEGRPADMMIANFFRAVFSNSIYMYQKQGANLALYPALAPQPTHAPAPQKTTETKADIKRAQLARALRSSTYAPDAEEAGQIHRINDFFGDSPPSGNILNSPSIVRPPQESAGESVVSAAVAVQKAVDSPPAAPQAEAKVVKEETPVVISGPAPAEGVPVAPKLVIEPVSNTPSVAPEAVSVSAPAAAHSADFPVMPDRGNVILGVVRDPRGKVLPNIIVEVQDAQKTPVRTFKTDAQGKFVAATPLADGSYTVVFEDPRGQHTFAPVTLALKGDILQPIVASSVDARESLRRELFQK